MGLVSEILKKVDTVTLNYTAESYQAIVSAHATELHLILVLYIALYGLAVLQGIVPGTTRELAKHILKAFIIFELASNWGMFTIFFYDVFTSGPDKLIGALTDGAKPTEQLSQVYDMGIVAAARIFIKAGTFDFGIMMMAILVAIATILMTGFALFLIILAKLGIAVLLSLAPLFIALALWRGTQGIFHSWVNYLINFALIPVITYGVLALIISIMEEAAKKIEMAGEAVTMNDVIPFLLIGAISGLIFAQVSRIASSLGSGMALSTMGAVSRYVTQPSKQIASKAGAKLSKAKPRLASSRQNPKFLAQGNAQPANALAKTQFHPSHLNKGSATAINRHSSKAYSRASSQSVENSESFKSESRKSLNSYQQGYRNFSERQASKNQLKNTKLQKPELKTTPTPSSEISGIKHETKSS